MQIDPRRAVEKYTLIAHSRFDTAATRSPFYLNKPAATYLVAFDPRVTSAKRCLVTEPDVLTPVIILLLA